MTNPKSPNLNNIHINPFSPNDLNSINVQPKVDNIPSGGAINNLNTINTSNISSQAHPITTYTQSQQNSLNFGGFNLGKPSTHSFAPNQGAFSSIEAVKQSFTNTQAGNKSVEKKFSSQVSSDLFLVLITFLG